LVLEGTKIQTSASSLTEEDEDGNRTNGLMNEVGESTTQSAELPFHFVCAGKKKEIYISMLYEAAPLGRSKTYLEHRRTG
jgi:hypothetical protein